MTSSHQLAPLSNLQWNHRRRLISSAMRMATRWWTTWKSFSSSSSSSFSPSLVRPPFVTTCITAARGRETWTSTGSYRSGKHRYLTGFSPFDFNRLQCGCRSPPNCPSRSWPPFSARVSSIKIDSYVSRPFLFPERTRKHNLVVKGERKYLKTNFLLVQIR